MYTLVCSMSFFFLAAYNIFQLLGVQVQKTPASDYGLKDKAVHILLKGIQTTFTLKLHFIPNEWLTSIYMTKSHYKYHLIIVMFSLKGKKQTLLILDSIVTNHWNKMPH